MMRYLCFYIFIFFSSAVVGQSEQLAKNYMEQGAYEKAVSIYQKLYTQKPYRTTYFLGLIAANQQLEQFQEAEALIQSHLKKQPNNPQLLVELGHHYDIQGDAKKSRTYYDHAVLAFKNGNATNAYALGKLFEKYNLLNEAAIVYEYGMEMNPKSNFSIQLAKIYGEQGKLEKMFESYLNLIQSQPNYGSIIRKNFSDYITDDATHDANIIFKKLLIKKLQQRPDLLYTKMLSWLFIQQKEFKKAFIQEKAMYKRNPEGGLHNILGLARIAISEKDMKSATSILHYILEQDASKDMKLKAHKIILKAKVDQNIAKEYPEIAAQYRTVFETYGLSKQTIGLQIDYAHFLAFNQDQKKEAIAFLKDLLKREQLSRFQSSRAKMEIADILVLDLKFNQALIYYTQVQNALKNNFLAQDARFKVAKTSYYRGDFKWAQTQLDVLKSSTSQLIANDAMELSLIINDNVYEDSTQTALKIFAKADLLSFQNKNKEAITLYESILTAHKGAKIEDEALYRQAKLYEEEKIFEKAKINYLKIIEFYSDDILADDAYYALAELYRTKLNMPEKAKELYEKLIFTYADSIYFVESRKKYRTLRGDMIN